MIRRPRVPWLMPMSAGARLVLPVLLTLLAACERVEQLVDARRDLTPHEAYAASLESAGLVGTALGQDWLAAAREALASAQPVPLPYREEGFLPAEDPAAVGLRLELK